MSIAQHDVAGEGEFCPATSENVNAFGISPHGEDGDAVALAAFPTDETNLPWVIFRAGHRAAHVTTLPQRARSLFAALARTVDTAHPYAVIFASRAVLHDRALQSKRTLYRALTDLESAGLIRRAGQLRLVTEGYEGRFGRTYLHLTEKAATLLGLVESARLATKADEAAKEGAVAPSQSVTQPCANLAHGPYIRDLSPTTFQKRQPGRVPADLHRLRPLGFQDFLIFKLMREAREHGKRLSDVVEATWPNLKKATRPICYLRALLHSTADFGNQVRSRDALLEADRSEAEKRERAEWLVRQSAGLTFVSTDGRRKTVIDADAVSATVFDVEEGIARREAGTWQVRFAQELDADRIRVATVADLECFAQGRRGHSVASISTPVFDGADRAPITTEIREYIAGLRNLVRPFRHALAPAGSERVDVKHPAFNS